MSLFSFLVKPADVAEAADPAPPAGEIVPVDTGDLPGDYPTEMLDDIARDLVPRPASYRIEIPKALPTVAGLGSIVAARTITIPAGQRRPERLGFSDLPTNEQIAYTVMYVTGAPLQIAGDESALTGARFTIPTGVGLALEHVANFWAWGDADTDVTVSMLVVGTH